MSTLHTVHDWLASYSDDHRHPLNQTIHALCVPAILWSVIAFLWVVPVPIALGRPGFWAGASMFFALTFYLKLSRVLGLAMLVWFILLGMVTEALHRLMGVQNLFWLALSVFALAWAGQFIGHWIEGRRPSFFTDLAYLLIGPAWLAAKLLRRLNIAY